ncbi:FMN-binding protein [Candidatus Fermentibacteria bacterium]|nr:FMN-binding protein [Candidatus Fermentibacteria bacterium]
MKKRTRRILTVVISIAIVLLAVAVWFKIRYDRMSQVFATAEVGNVDLTEIDDGTYKGSFGEFLVSVELEVTVQNNAITDIEVIDQHSGPGYEALETIDRIIAAQSPEVDALSGATISSQCIMVATYRALKGGD